MVHNIVMQCRNLAAAAFFALAACSSDVNGNIGPQQNDTDTAGSDPTTSTSGDTADGDPTTSTPSDTDDAPPTAPADTDSLTDFEATIATLPPDTWYEAPNSHMADFCPTTIDHQQLYGPQSYGCRAVVSAWSSGVYDSDHHQMLVWGGGHGDYPGNEVYAFALKTGTWSRLTDPSDGPYNQDPLADGKPVSRHTYGGLAWLTREHRMFAQGGARATDGVGTNVMWLFDPEAKAWTSPGSGGPSDYSMAAAYDPVDDTVYMQSYEGFWKYPFATSTWILAANFGFPPLWPRYAVYVDKNSTIDSSRRLLWTVGGGEYLVWDLAAGTVVTDAWATTGGGVYDNAAQVSGYDDQHFTSGGGDIINADAPGFEYDAKADAIVAWAGGSPYILDLASKTWTHSSAQGPATEQANGTYGRWRYIDYLNAFILVNAVDTNVFFYKHTAGTP